MSNMDGEFSAREVIYESSFDESLAAISPDIRRMDEILEGLVWGISQKPEEFAKKIPGMNVWKATMKPIPNMPGMPGSLVLKVLFTLDENSATLLHIEPVIDN